MNNIHPVTQYALEAVEKVRVVGKTERLACLRHLLDLARAHELAPIAPLNRPTRANPRLAEGASAGVPATASNACRGLRHSLEINRFAVVAV